jgi:iron complex outermembrane receptor protein
MPSRRSRLTTGIMIGLLGAVPCSVTAQDASEPDKPVAQVSAQDAGPAPEATDPAELDLLTMAPIVVTAQKRVERLQDVPISIAVVSNATLEAFSMNEANDLQHLVPGLTLVNAAGTRNAGFFVRGIGTTSFSSESIEGSTAYVLDGVVLGQSGASFADLPDIERIEVLRGPQGTLFGKNSSAGVINVTTIEPTDVFSGKLSATWASPNNERRVAGYISGPISDDAGFLLSARVNKRDGYIENVHDGRRFNDRDEWGMRGKLKLVPSDQLQVMITGDYYKREAACCIWTIRNTGPIVSPTEQLQLNAGITFGRDNNKQNIDGDVFSNNIISGVSVQADYDLGDGYSLTSITAGRRYRSFDGLDSDSMPFDILNVNFADFRQKQVTQEIRLTSPAGRAVDYVLGLFYFDGEVNATSTQRFPTLPFPFLNKTAETIASTRNSAVFGQANFNLSDKFRLIAGARWLEEKAEASRDRHDFLFDLRNFSEASKRDTAVLWRAGAQYDFSKDIMGFATVTRGYKGGGYDTNIGLSNLPDVQPERPTNTELGLRMAFPAQRIILNATAFHTDVDGYQTAARDPGPPPVTHIFNGDAKTRGLEFDLHWRPLDESNWTITGSGAYVDAKWGTFTNAPCHATQTAAEGCVDGQQDLTGTQLPFSAKWSGSLASSYATQVRSDIDLVFNLGVNYRSDVHFGAPAATQQGYALVNASITLAQAYGKWRVSLFGKNLTNKRYSLVDFATPIIAGGSYSQFVPYEAQRIIGISAEVGF